MAAATLHTLPVLHEDYETDDDQVSEEFDVAQVEEDDPDYMPAHFYPEERDEDTDIRRRPPQAAWDVIPLASASRPAPANGRKSRKTNTSAQHRRRRTMYFEIFQRKDEDKPITYIPGGKREPFLDHT